MNNLYSMASQLPRDIRFKSKLQSFSEILFLHPILLGDDEKLASLSLFAQYCHLLGCSSAILYMGCQHNYVLSRASFILCIELFISSATDFPSAGPDIGV
jgi:hypothetical protein